MSHNGVHNYWYFTSKLFNLFSSICYYFPQFSAVFTGDTIFSGGAGRFFEGTADQMVAAFDKVMALPPSTKMYPGHEYTVANLSFATKLEPENLDATFGKVQKVTG